MNEIKTLSELVQHAYQEAKTGKTSPELLVYKSSGLDTLTGANGGYAVTAQMSASIMAETLQQSLCYSKAKKLSVTKGKSVKIPYAYETTDETTGTNMLKAYFPGEGEQKTSTYERFGQLDLNLNTLAVICPCTEELLEDAQQLESWLKIFVPQRMAQAIDARMIWGDPATSLWGITSAGAVGVIGVANADPITLANMIAYEKALAPAVKNSSEWYMGTEQYNELLDLIDDTKTNTGYKWEEDGLYVFGHKVNVCEFLKKNQYDLILGDFGQYVIAERALQFATSISFKFNLDEKWLRWTIRINGASFGNKVTLDDGSVVAPFVIPAEGPVEMSSSSSSDSGASVSSSSSYSNSSDSSESPAVSGSSDSTGSDASGSSASTDSTSSASSMSNSSASSGDSGSSASSMSNSSASNSSSSSTKSESSSSVQESRSSASSLSNSSNSSNSSNG